MAAGFRFVVKESVPFEGVCGTKKGQIIGHTYLCTMTAECRLQLLSLILCCYLRNGNSSSSSGLNEVERSFFHKYTHTLLQRNSEREKLLLRRSGGGETFFSLSLPPPPPLLQDFYFSLKFQVF